jgi:hypothetical protein
VGAIQRGLEVCHRDLWYCATPLRGWLASYFAAQVAALLLYFVGYASLCDSSGGWDWDEDVRG